MASDQSELDSFYRKFLGLRKFGRNATLRMESGPDGKCLVNLQLELPTRSEPGPQSTHSEHSNLSSWEPKCE